MRQRQLVPGRRFGSEQAIAPVLDLPLVAQAGAIDGAFLLERGDERVRVDAAQQLADVEPLSQPCAMTGDFARGVDGVADVFGQRERVELAGRQLDERVTKVLEVATTPLELALARRLEIRV